MIQMYTHLTYTPVLFKLNEIWLSQKHHLVYIFLYVLLGCSFPLTSSVRTEFKKYLM